MSFLGYPCHCGWAMNEINNNERHCEKCNRHLIKEEWGWNQITPRHEVKEISFCRHKREVGQVCPHCFDGLAHEILS